MKEKIKNYELADDFLQDDRYKENLLYCVSYDLFYLFEEGYYRDISTQEFSGIVRNFIITKYPELNTTMTLINDVVEQTKLGAYHKREDMVSPYIAFKDFLYNLETFKFQNFDREKIAIHKLDYKVEELDKGKCSTWQYFLESTLVDEDLKPDNELITVVQEMFGFYLLNDLKAHKVFFLVGSGANGKSVMLNVLEKMMGEKFISAMSIQTLTTNQFATSSLIGKKINICNEEESKYLRSDKFKALISGDLVDADRKFENNFAFRPTTKYIFASNMLPSFDGMNLGVRRRMTIIPFNRIFKDKEQDKDLSEKLFKEMPAIIKWAMDGAKKLVENKYIFSQSKAIYGSGIEFENLTSSALLFMRENYRIDLEKNPMNFISNKQIYKNYVDWCVENGKKSLSSFALYRDLSSNLGMKSSIMWYSGGVSRGHFLIRISEGIDPADYKDKEKDFEIVEKDIDEILKDANG